MPLKYSNNIIDSILDDIQYVLVLLKWDKRDGEE